MTIDLIGAGIGGLTTAIALRQQGLEVRVWERAPLLQPVGAGIILAANALQVYRELGLLPALQRHGRLVQQSHITDAQLRALSSTDWAVLEAQFGVPTLSIHRGALQQVLLEALPPDVLHLNHALERVEPTKQGAVLVFANGKRVESTCVIGADGIHSQVRKALYPEAQLRGARQYCWRGVAPCSAPEGYADTLIEAWGKGIRLGFVQIGPQQVYWFAVESMSGDGAPTATADLAERFREFDPRLGALIAQTPTDSIHGTELSELRPLPQWHRGAVGLLGDAAHAPTPNLGQGAGQAIEDARVLAHCLAQRETPAEAFAQFETLRRPKIDKIVRVSWLIGQVAHWQNPIARQLRRLLLKTTPQRTQQQQLKELATLVPLAGGVLQKK